MKRRISTRNRGSVATLAFVAAIPLVAAIGGFAVDCMHVNDAKGELQRACDAAALAGGEDLGSYAGHALPDSATTTANADERSLKYAFSVAALNFVDGPTGLATAGQRSCTATIGYDSTLGGAATTPNYCEVDGTIFLRSLFAQIFGNFGQTVTAKARAGRTPLNQATGYGPLLVSLPDPDLKGDALQNLTAGSPFSIDVKVNSIWIYHSNPNNQYDVNWIANPTIGPAPGPPVIIGGDNLGDLSVGDYLKSSNGYKNVDLSPLYGKTVLFAVTNDNNSGNKPILGVGRPVHLIVGFILVKVTGPDPLAKHESLAGTIVANPFPGSFYPGGFTNVVPFGPYLVRLVQ